MVIAHAVERTLANTALEVAEGAIVKAVFIEMWVRSGTAVEGAVLLTFSKNPDLGTPAFADTIALDAWTNKKNVFYHTQGLTNDENADAIPFIRQWFKIPKGKQRMGLGDRLILTTTAQAIDADICGFATYKEYG